MEIITSRTNPLCTHFRKLASSRSYREKTGECLCDSPKLLREAELWGQTVTAVMYTEGTVLPPLSGPARVVQVTESVMRSVSPMETPQGVVFSCLKGKTDPPERLAPGRYLLLGGVQDPGNVGTILRTADAFGWTVVLLPGCADLYNPKTIRAGMGVHFRQVIYCCALERAAELVALVDTGNTLTDPVSGRPVMVAEGEKVGALFPDGQAPDPEELRRPVETLERLGRQGWQGRCRLLPYQAVGVECGMLLALRLDRAQVGAEDYGGILVALSPTRVSDGGGYSALIGAME